MTTYIPRLARITSGRSAGRKRPPHLEDGQVFEERRNDPVTLRTLARLAPRLRTQLGIGTAFSDDALLASIVSIARHPSHEERWHAAEASTLAQYLASTGTDVERALVTLLSMLPKP